jgi:hypothetical protein
LLNLFGNGHRTELPPEADGSPLREDPWELARLWREVKETFGLRIPAEGRLAWPAVETEIVPAGTHSQAHHAHLVPGLANAWLALQGKLSQSAACAADLARRALREHLRGDVAESVWEQIPAISPSGLSSGK